MNIVETENKLKQVDSLLTTLTKVIKKHWLILLLIFIGFIIYLKYDSIENQPENIEQTSNEYLEDNEYYLEEDSLQE